MKINNSLRCATIREGSPEEVDELEEAELVVVLAAVKLIKNGKDALVIELEALTSEEEEELSN